MKKLSVITINFNNAAGLKKTLESIACSSYPKELVECRVIDGGSTDGSIDVIKQFESVVDAWVSEPDKGIFDAMNKGMRAAEGEYIIYMNSGDWFAEGALTADLLTNLRGAIFYGDYLLFDGEKSMLHRQTSEIDFLYLIIRTICHQALFMRTELCRKYPFREDLRIIGDWIQLFTIMKKEDPEVVYYPKPICHYDATGLSVQQNEKRLEQREQFLREWYSEWELRQLRQLGRLRGRIWYSWIMEGLDSGKKHHLLKNLSKWMR